MATVNFTKQIISDDNIVYSWAGLTGGDVGAAIYSLNFVDKTVQAWGTIGAAITIQGTNDPRAISDPSNAQWVTVKDSYGADISFSSAGGALMAQNYTYIRPSCASGTTNATVALNCTRY
jgi:hypothetical protein